MYRFKKGSGFPVSVPSVDLVEIGAGGGSLARASTTSACSRSGPSPPAPSPGPACYGRGGTKPAVTDADVLLGLLDPDYFLGGDMELDRGAADAAVGGGRRRSSACRSTRPRPASTTSSTRTWRPRRACTASSRASTCRGVSLIAFGGAGPVHACAVAELLESTRVIFPVNASVLSAFGTLVSPVRIDLARSLVRHARHASTATSAIVCSTSCGPKGAACSPPRASPRRDVRFRYGIDARYAGQGNEITMWVGEGDQLARSTTTPCAATSTRSTGASTA